MELNFVNTQKGILNCTCGECNDAFYINAYNKFYEFKNKKEEKK